MRQFGNVVQGDARIGFSVSTGEPLLNDEFTHLYDIDAANRLEEIRWNLLGVTNGAFSIGRRVRTRGRNPNRPEICLLLTTPCAGPAPRAFTSVRFP